MTGKSAFEERNWIVSQLRADGHQIDGDQLGRWHKVGLIPSPETKHLGKAKGTESRYPVGTLAQVRRVHEIFDQEPTNAARGWRLWWEGWPVKPELVRRYLAGLAAGLEKSLDPPAGIIDTMTNARSLRGPLKERRADLGPKRFAALMQAVLDMLQQAFNPTVETRDLQAATAIVRNFQVDYDPKLAEEHALPSNSDTARTLGASGVIARALFTNAKTALDRDFAERASKARDLAHRILTNQIVPGSTVGRALRPGALGERYVTESYEADRTATEGTLVLLLLAMPFVPALEGTAELLEENSALIERLTSARGDDET